MMFWICRESRPKLNVFLAGKAAVEHLASAPLGRSEKFR
jgi:hypothetical protein